MIKHINHQNVSTTPFVASKARALYNIQNDDSVILEPDVYLNGTTVSLDYVDYNYGDPIINGDCNIALEQQGLDSIGYEEGITGSGTFNSASDAQNADGTYKSLVHRQIKNAFYNLYHNPTEIFGIEHIDFPLSKTLRNLSEQFRMFTIPRLIFGDKIQPKSVKFYDTLLDDNVEIFDDGYQNLIGGYNLFSKIQEVRIFPSGSNLIFPGTSSYNCITYGSLFITDPQDVYADIGTTIMFCITASGTMPFYYQWQSGSIYLTDTSRITGSNQICLVINNVQLSDTGSYQILVNNLEQGKTSSYAILHVNTYPPVIVTQPVPASNDIGNYLSFSVTASGGLPMYYQWESGSTLLTDGTRISGSYLSGRTTSSLYINDLTLTDSGSYRVMISNIFGVGMDME